MVNTAKNFFNMLNNLQQMHLKKSNSENSRITGDLRGTKITKVWNIHNKMIQRQLQMNMTKKYLIKDMYLQKKYRKLLMIWDQYNSIIMEYQKIINLLDNTPNQPSTIEINDDARETYNKDSQIKFKTSVLKSSWCDHSDAY